MFRILALLTAMALVAACTPAATTSRPSPRARASRSAHRCRPASGERRSTPSARRTPKECQLMTELFTSFLARRRHQCASAPPGADADAPRPGPRWSARRRRPRPASWGRARRARSGAPAGAPAGGSSGVSAIASVSTTVNCCFFDDAQPSAPGPAQRGRRDARAAHQCRVRTREFRRWSEREPASGDPCLAPATAEPRRS